MDPIRNPYAPGAGQRPPELAGRDEQLHAFDVTLERVARGRPERSVVLTGLRGVGKTVLLNALRSAAVRAHWGTGKLEARPAQPLRRPLSAALHLAVPVLGPRPPDEAARVLGALTDVPETPAEEQAQARQPDPQVEQPDGQREEPRHRRAHEAGGGVDVQGQQHTVHQAAEFAAPGPPLPRLPDVVELLGR